MIDSFSANESLVLLGDYGTGKTVVIQSVAEKLRNSDRDLVYINALDTTDWKEEKYHKTWEDVLDVIVKLRFSSGVTVLDMGTLRSQYLERNEGKNKGFLKVFENHNNVKEGALVLFQNHLREILLTINPENISVPDNITVSTLELIGDYISNLTNAKNTVVGVMYRIYFMFSSLNIPDYL